MNYGNLTDNKGIEVGSPAHRRAWEAGHIDYFGRDSFANIEQQLQRNIEQRSYQSHPRQISPDKTPSTTAPTVSQNVTELPSKTSILKGSTNGTTAPHSTIVPPLTTSTATLSQNVTKLPTQTTSQLKSSSNGSTTVTQKTSTTSVVQTKLNEVTTIPREEQSSSKVPSKTPLHGVTSVSQSQTSSHSKDLPKQVTSSGIISQTTTEFPPITTIKITPNVLQNRSEQSNLSQPSNGRVTNAQSHSVLQDSKLTSIPVKTSSTVLKESTTLSHRENHPFVSTIFLDDSLIDFVFSH